jgi:group I intron endonuclease
MNDNSNGEWKVTGEMPTKNEEKLEKDTIIISGIYGLQNKQHPEKWYIGQSIDVYTRWERDYKKMKCIAQPKLYNALKKYGYDGFNKVLLEQCSAEKEVLDSREIYWMDYYESTQNGYNLRKGGNGHGWHSDETKQKIKIAREKQKIGKGHVSEEARKRMSEDRIGKKLSEEHRIKLSISHMGNKQTEESKKKISNTMKGRTGRKWTDEQKLKKSLLMTGTARGPYKSKN